MPNSIVVYQFTTSSPFRKIYQWSHVGGEVHFCFATPDSEEWSITLIADEESRKLFAEFQEEIEAGIAGQIITDPDKIHLEDPLIWDDTTGGPADNFLENNSLFNGEEN